MLQRDTHHRTFGCGDGIDPSKDDPQDKRYLVKTLEKYARAGFGFIIAFDADCATNPSVIKAEMKLAKQLRKFNVPVHSITGMWSVDEGKGMDDYIQKNGIEAFRAILLKANERQPDEGEGEGKKKQTLPPANVTASVMAEIYRDKLAWESEYQLWRHYGAKHDGVWSEETVESVRGLIHAHLRTLPDSPAFNAGYVSSVLTILQSDLEVKDWNESNLLPLRDGALEIDSGELLTHSPSNRFTWQLPFKWEDRGIGCEPIEEFLLKITGHRQIAEVLLAFLSAIVTRRSDLQRYLELIGGGGTGKSTYMALAKALAGDDNAVTSRLSLLEKNQFETAKFYKKLLVLFPDSERWQGEVSVLKQLTGQDPIRYERKGVQQCRDYVYEGMVILSANEPPESSDRTSGQERRKLTIGLDNRIPEYEGRNLIEEFKSFLPGLLKRVLEMPRERVTALIKHTERNVPALAAKKWEQMVETNPIAAWVDECLFLTPQPSSTLGRTFRKVTSDGTSGLIQTSWITKKHRVIRHQCP
jgi:putative DNA primase/helicase